MKLHFSPRKFEEVKVLYDVSRIVNSTLDLKAVLQFIMDLTHQIFKAEAGSIMLLNEDNLLIIEVAKGLSKKIIQDTSVPMGEGIAGWVALQGKPLLLQGKVRGPKFRKLVDREEAIQSSLCVPLKTKNRVIGVLMLRNPTGGQKFTEADLRFLSVVADQAAMAVENARLYQKEKMRVQEMLGLISELKHSTQMKSEIVSMVTHDLKTPLTSIHGFAEVMLAKNLAPEVTQQYLSIMKDEASRMVRIIENLLDLAKLEAGQIKLNKRHVDLLKTIQGAIQTMILQSAIHHISFVHPSKVPLVVADADLITQVLHNLLSNAIKYSPKGGRIEVALNLRKQDVEVHVTDQGIGIPQSKLPQLFDRFYRVNTHSGISGTGLGLANVKYIIEAHGGALRVKSKEGKGSTFTFSLPLKMKEIK